MVDPMHFDAQPEQYERARPPYPEALWTRLTELGLLSSDIRVVELGAGTGQATEHLMATCGSVTAIEPGRALARRLHQRFPEVEVLSTTAEDALLPDRAFDLAAAATSIHWLNLRVVLPKLNQALTRNGHLAVWRNSFGDPAISTPFRERVNAIVAQRAESSQRPDPSGLDTAQWTQRLTQDGYFTHIHTDHFSWSIDLSADQIHALFSTFSDWTAAEVDTAATAANELGGEVTEHYVTPLTVLKSNQTHERR